MNKYIVVNLPENWTISPENTRIISSRDYLTNPEFATLKNVRIFNLCKDYSYQSKAPLIASHSSARSLCDHSRNLDDDLLALFREKGGVIQTVAFSSYLNTEKHANFNEAAANAYKRTANAMGLVYLERDSVRKLDNSQKEIYAANFKKIKLAAKNEIEDLKKTTPPVNVEDFIDHIDYLVEKVGIDHVGISSDFDGGGGIDGWQDASESLNVTVALVKRGYTETEIAKLWGENLLRVMDEVQQVSKQWQD